MVHSYLNNDLIVIQGDDFKVLLSKILTKNTWTTL